MSSAHFSLKAIDAIAYMKRKGFAHRNRDNIIFNKFFIGVNSDGHSLLFVKRSASGYVSDMYVCEICERGFATIRGLADHQLTSPNHTRDLETYISQICETSVMVRFIHAYNASHIVRLHYDLLRARWLANL